MMTWAAEYAPEEVKAAVPRVCDPLEVPAWYSVGEGHEIPAEFAGKTIAIYIGNLADGTKVRLGVVDKVRLGVVEKDIGRGWWVDWATAHRKKQGGVR